MALVLKTSRLTPRRFESCPLRQTNKKDPRGLILFVSSGRRRTVGSDEVGAERKKEYSCSDFSEATPRDVALRQRSEHPVPSAKQIKKTLVVLFYCSD